MPSLVVTWAMTALLLVSLSTANPTISFPLNSQVPPVARIGQLFSFVFSPSTFTSSSAIAYSLSNPPRWLSLDSDARRLFGTPEEEDVAPGRVVAVPLNLVATDDSGSTTLSATLVVSRSPGPMVEIPFDKQAPDFGTFSAPSAILSPPGKAFSFRLDPNTFSKPSDAPVSYYATMADNTPLPAWISFDPTSLSFMGQTPPSESLVQPPERFSFQVIASDVVGFAGSSLSFDIVVGNHQLTANKTTIVLNATPGIPVSYTGLRSAVSVDGKPATAQVALVATTPNIPAWLSLDNDTWRITGVPPGTAESTNFTVTICDTFSDELNLTVSVNVTRDNAGLFRGTPPNFTVSPGAHFSFDLRPYLLSPLDTEISIKTDPSYSWIRFNSSTATLFGDVPAGLTDSAVDVTVKAASRDSKRSASFSFDFLIRAVPGSRGSTLTTTGPAATKSPGGRPSLAGDSLGDGRFNPLLLAVLLPVFLLLALAICALFWYFRQRRARQKPPLSTRDISGPLPGSFVTRTASPSVSHSLPDLTKRFGKSFSADDVFGSEKKYYLESRSAFLTRPDLARHTGEVRILAPNSSPAADPGAVPEATTTPIASSMASGALLPETRRKVSSSLSSITEASLGELVDSRGLESVGNASRQSFRDKIEINVPRLPQTPGSTHTCAPSPAEPVSTPWIGSPLTASDTDAVPLRAESRLSYYPPAAAMRKVSWPWFKAFRGKHQGSKLIPRLKRLSEQPSVLTTDSPVSEPTVLQDNGHGRSIPDSPPLPLTEVPTSASLSGPPTRSRSGSAASRYPEKLDQVQPETSGTTADSATQGPSVLSVGEHAAPSFLDQGDTPADSLSIYDDIVNRNPFCPSRTWSTVPMTDETVDETVGSPALSRSASQQQRNWTVLQESPVITGRDDPAPTSGMLPEMVSSVRLPQAKEGEEVQEAGKEGAKEKDAEGEGGQDSLASRSLVPSSSRPQTATSQNKGVRDPGWSGPPKSQSKGVSLHSEGSKSDYAVFI